jgi:hypothetical protein
VRRQADEVGAQRLEVQPDEAGLGRHIGRSIEDGGVRHDRRVRVEAGGELSRGLVGQRQDGIGGREQGPQLSVMPLGAGVVRVAQVVHRHDQR